MKEMQGRDGSDGGYCGRVGRGWAVECLGARGVGGGEKWKDVMRIFRRGWLVEGDGSNRHI